MTKEPRLLQGPPPVQPASECEQKILALARRYAMEFPGSPDNGGQPGHWYKPDAPPELVRVDFLKAAGRSHLLDELAGHELEVHRGRADQGLIGITVWFRNADRYRSFLKALKGAGFDSWFADAFLPLQADSIHGRERPRARLRPREGATVARVLAIHYLSRSGGGSRTLEESAELYRTEMERFAQENKIAGYPRAEGWEALPLGWRNERARVLHELREDLGPV